MTPIGPSGVDVLPRIYFFFQKDFREVIIKKNESVDFVQTFLDPLPAPLKFGHQNRIILLSPFELSNFYRIYIVHV